MVISSRVRAGLERAKAHGARLRLPRTGAKVEAVSTAGRDPRFSGANCLNV
jgi:hypothetical protein